MSTSRKIEITVGSAKPWSLFRRKCYRRDLPSSWGDLQPSRRLSLFRILLSAPEHVAQVAALREILRLPKAAFLGLDAMDIQAMLDAMPWLRMAESAEPILAEFRHRGQMYYAPKSHGLNLVGLEYPIADEAFNQYLASGKKDDLNLLVGTLYREPNPNSEAAISRGDVRIPLLSRWEAEARAIRIAGVDDTVKIAALLYFAGVKKYVHQAYGQHLFEQPEEDEEGNPIPATTPSLGWWGVYFNLATDGPFGRNVEEVYQTSFHDICLYLVERKRQQDKIDMERRMKDADYGLTNP